MGSSDGVKSYFIGWVGGWVGLVGWLMVGDWESKAQTAMLKFKLKLKLSLAIYDFFMVIQSFPLISILLKIRIGMSGGAVGRCLGSHQCFS